MRIIDSLLNVLVFSKSMDADDLIKSLLKSCARHEIAVMEFVDPLAELLNDNPKEGVKKIFEVYNNALDSAYTDERGENHRVLVQAYAGGPAESVPWAVYNAVGSVYPYLDRETKDGALGELLHIFDGLNCGYVNGSRGVGHTTGIREPLLLSDIGVVRRLYWPGLDEGRAVLKQYKFFHDFEKEMIDERGLFNQKKVQSDFVVAYAVLRSDYCSFGGEYVKCANQNFLERVLRGIVWMRFGRCESFEEIKKGMARLRDFLPESVHERLEPLRQEGGWVDYKKFR